MCGMSIGRALPCVLAGCPCCCGGGTQKRRRIEQEEDDPSKDETRNDLIFPDIHFFAVDGINESFPQRSD